MQRNEEWMLTIGKDPPLRHGALDVVVLDNHILLQHLNKYSIH